MDFTMPEWVSYLILVLIVVVVIGWKFGEDIRFYFQGRWTEGVIINWMSASEKGRKYFYPLIEFTTLEGYKFQYRADERSEGKPFYSPGTSVKVKYLPSNPKKVKTVYP